MKITVAVAVYNVEKYIKPCLQSLLENLPEWAEVLIIDDASSDNSGKICDTFGAQNVKVIHFEENCGVCAVRNYAIENANGDYIAFLDGDDILPPYFFDAVQPLLQSGDDILFFSYGEFRNDSEIKYDTDGALTVLSENDIRAMAQFVLVSSSTIERDKKYAPIRQSSIWAKAYRRGMLLDNNVRFPDNQRKSQDLVFNSYAYFYAKTAVFLNRRMYFYRQNPQSICHRYNPQITQIAHSLLENCEKVLDALYGNDISLSELFVRYRVVMQLFTCMELDFFHKDNPKSRSERRREFESLCESTPYKEAIEDYEKGVYWNERNLMLRLIREKRFDAIDLLYRFPLLLKMYGKLKSFEVRK